MSALPFLTAALERHDRPVRVETSQPGFSLRPHHLRRADDNGGPADEGGEEVQHDPAQAGFLAQVLPADVLRVDHVHQVGDGARTDVQAQQYAQCGVPQGALDDMPLQIDPCHVSHAQQRDADQQAAAKLALGRDQQWRR